MADLVEAGLFMVCGSFGFVVDTCWTLRLPLASLFLPSVLGFPNYSSEKGWLSAIATVCTPLV